MKYLQVLVFKVNLNIQDYPFLHFRHLSFEQGGRFFYHLLALFYGGPGFKSGHKDRLYLLRFFVIFLSFSRQIQGLYFYIGYERFLPYLF
jgi:hypothetical protein